MTTLDTRCIVVPTDLGAEARRALAQARALAGGHDAVHIAHVISPRVLRAARELDVEAAIREALERWGPDLPPALRHLLHGEPGPALAALCRDLGATLVVVPAHRIGVIERIFLGSFTEQVARAVPSDVLIVPPDGGAPLLRRGTARKVVVGWDGSPGSRRAVRLALDLVDRPAGVTAVHVLPELQPPYLDAGLWSQDLERADHEEVARRLGLAMASLGAAGAHRRVDMGPPGPILAELGRILGASLVAVGARGESGRADGLGPVAGRLLRRCRLPVLLARSR